MHPKHLSLIAALPNWAGQIKLNAASVAVASHKGNGAKATGQRQRQLATAAASANSNKNNSYYNNLLQKYKLEHL